MQNTGTLTPISTILNSTTNNTNDPTLMSQYYIATMVNTNSSNNHMRENQNFNLTGRASNE